MPLSPTKQVAHTDETTEYPHSVAHLGLVGFAKDTTATVRQLVKNKQHPKVATPTSDEVREFVRDSHDPDALIDPLLGKTVAPNNLGGFAERLTSNIHIDKEYARDREALEKRLQSRGFKGENVDVEPREKDKEEEVNEEEESAEMGMLPLR